MSLSKKFHFVGIGGIGMSALAKLMQAQNYQVSGSDLSLQGEVEKLKSLKIPIFHGHGSQNISDAETTVIYSTAISEENAEMAHAKSLGCKLWHRSKLLDYLMRPYDSLAISGTHGKTTTSALLTHVLLSSSLDPTFVIGGLLTKEKTNSSVGKGKYFVLEADESDGTLVHYFPKGAICLNLEKEHIDYFYRDLEHIQAVFKQFSKQVEQKELFFWCKDCPNLKLLDLPGYSYGFDQASDLVLSNYQQVHATCVFDLLFKGQKYSKIKLNLMGKQNASNAASVFGLCLQLGIDEKDIRKAFETFLGVSRRSERLGSVSKVTFYDDYAHHPTEVQCTLKAFRRAFPKRRLIAVFQPHRYSRLKSFREEFAKSFKKASEVWLTDVYACEEAPLKDFSMESFREEIEQGSDTKVYFVKKDELTQKLASSLKPFDVVLTLGAGDVSLYGKEAFKYLQEKKPKLKVGVLFGGESPEHYISKISKNYVLKGLDQDHYETKSIYVDLMGYWSEGPDYKNEAQKLPASLYQKLLELDFIFPIFHGPNGEDGMFSAFFEMLSIPYAGPSSKTCALTLDKVWTKRVVEAEGIHVGEVYSFDRKKWRQQKKPLIERLEATLSYPMVVKPNRLGSSIGISFVTNREELLNQAALIFEIDDVMCVEKRIKGREFEILLFDADTVLCPRPGEILSQKRRYSYESKYSKDPIIKIPQADLTDPQIQMCQRKAKQIYRALRIQGCLRIDFFIDQKGEFIFGEANPMPGMTPRSLFPRMLEANGLSCEKVIDYFVIQGLLDHRLRTRKSKHYQHFAQSLRHVTE